MEVHHCMSSENPAGARIVAYFFLITLVLAFLSVASPVSPGKVREIPQSTVWGEPVIIDEVPAVVKTPLCAVDSQKTAHILYYDKTDDQTDLFYATVKDKIVSEPQNLTAYPSLKGPAGAALDSGGNVYTAFLDNRKGRWQVFLLDVSEDTLMQITDSNTHKEDVYVSTGEAGVVVTWTDFEGENPFVFLSILDSQKNLKKFNISEYPSSKASTICDTEKIHMVYLEKRVYDHVIYAQMDFSGTILAQYDLGECIHMDDVSLGVFKGPQFVVGDTVTCVWSDSSTGSHNLYYAAVTESGEVKEKKKLTEYPFGMWSWMPSIAYQDGAVHMVYVNNGFGHRIFHSKLDTHYQELGTVTSDIERATVPVLAADDEGFLHCVYLRFKGNTFQLVYRNTYPHEEKQLSLSERIKETSIRYLYSFAFSFLFSFPLTFQSNFWGICLLVAGFFAVRFFNLGGYLTRRYEYFLFGGLLVGLSLLRGPINYSPLALMAYEPLFVGYGVVVSAGAASLFMYCIRDRFGPEVRILLSCFVFLYFVTFFLFLPVVPYM
jgi:hypothetical protein